MQDAARFMGVDVGTSRVLAACIDYVVDPPMVRFAPSCEREQVVEWIRRAEPTHVAVDAPSSVSHGLRRGENRRVVEALLGIGGCYGTPARAADAPVWIRNGLSLHDELGQVIGDDRVFEVNATLGFRSLLGVRFASEPERVVCDPRRQLLPNRPRSRGGHDQRVALIASLLAEWGVVMPSEEALDDLDRVDALMGACLSYMRAHGQVHQVGESREGFITIASERDMSALLEDKPASAGRSRPSLAPVPLQGAEGVDGFAVFVGDKGPGGMELRRALETIASRPEGNCFYPVPLTPGRLGGTDRPPPFDVILFERNGYVRTNGGIGAMRAMLRVTHVYTPHDGMLRSDLMGERDPWPEDLPSDKIQWLEFEHAVVREEHLTNIVEPVDPIERTDPRFAFRWLPGERVTTTD